MPSKPDSPAPAAGGVRPAPLWAVLAFTFLASAGTGVATTGVPFLAESAYGFGEIPIFVLAALYGAVYVPGALLVGPALRRAARRHAWLTTRRLLAALTLALGLFAALPLLTRPAEGEAGTLAGTWAIWLLAIANGLLSGASWPIVESYLSGGRRGERLRHATGLFNITWSSSLVATLIALGPFVHGRPLEALAAMLPVYAACAILTLWMGREPARSLPDEHPTRPAAYRRLLAVFRVQLPASFLLLAVLEPVAPFLMARVGIEDPWAAPAAAIWLATRLATFVVFARWGGWHGRWRTPILAAALMLLGFAGVTIGPTLDAAAGRTLLLGGLAVLGCGVGMVYAAALYYAMEVGDAEIDAGGRHEAFIGLGYTAGPVLGVLAYVVAAPRGPLAASPTLLLLGLVGSIMIVLCLGSVAWACRSSRGPE
ncbi:MAG: MFS transporter [Planctomycetota bacterium]